MPELSFNADPVPATPIGDMKGWRLHIQCERCRRHSVLPLDYMAKQHGPRTRLIDVMLRLRCDSFRGAGKCRGRPRLVTLVKVAIYGKSARKLRQITVVDASNPWPRPPLAPRPW
ncbi:hypothetical protein [Limobrevibacterium gyesilva]|uniref:Uncharacterized protein n=1 Tax=Limobrevibacterium gyesilva TaxID=2991712 RepID=A0AA42CF97_9PROT|nr:hypothetical protein [Limobrevibacterium gyesilva]MCW3476314.1 hypothetical protein [Limobrevibacterium gyesilva]